MVFLGGNQTTAPEAPARGQTQTPVTAVVRDAHGVAPALAVAQGGAVTLVPLDAALCVRLAEDLSRLAGRLIRERD